MTGEVPDTEGSGALSFQVYFRLDDKDGRKHPRLIVVLSPFDITALPEIVGCNSFLFSQVIEKCGMVDDTRSWLDSLCPFPFSTLLITSGPCY